MVYVQSDDTPGKGIYVCSKCGTAIKLETDTTKLPECPNCGNDTFIKTKDLA